ncbi:predicted protein [Uncinocarpus reesii 1704]|uniref:Uncharacterized protein n=1 Tax=Uncinocarpus reesii (strain UAMH 1704) TaxID=336963 RepID=C4K061_UNCRE|nr:uncharacterized protein UREG_07812 [Uncinocarpus reesii 1704]EEP82947.1 predicted protein [Uncinocarpus reesii 1704]
MIISSRRDPYRTAVRRAPTPSNIRLTPRTLRVPFIDSPLPSPGLPSIFPRRTSKPSRSRLLRNWRTLGLVIGCCIVIAWLILPPRHVDSAALSYQSQGGDAYEIVESNVLPDIAGPIMIKDKKGRARWTISLPPERSLPLPPSDYARICMEAEDLATHVARTMNAKPRTANGQYYGFHYEDKSFLDIADAENQGLLPSTVSVQPGAVAGSEGYQTDLPLCKRSLTFLLQSDDAGLGPTLMGLWMAYGFAKAEGRDFFIDDSSWAYGTYTTYFKPPPIPACRPPPVSHRIPCPAQARHLLISPSTFRWIFDSTFDEKFQSRHQTGVDRHKPIFSLLRTGFECLFRLNDQDNELYKKRIKELRAESNGAQIGIHIRRGDRHPLEFQYENSYIPLDVYARGAEELVKSIRAPDLSHLEGGAMILASDDPDVHFAPEMMHTRKAQSFISLISKSTLDTVSPGQKRPVDENSGWEGGFFSSLFWSLGSPLSRPMAPNSPPPSGYPTTRSAHKGHGQSSSPSADRRTFLPDNDHFRFHPPESALRLREFVARAYLLDLAVLSSSDAIVCGVSSVSCRLLGVMLGWEKAIEQKKWKNVDGSMHWQGFIW